MLFHKQVHDVGSTNMGVPSAIPCPSSAVDAERAHAHPKALYKQTNEQENRHCYLRTMMKHHQLTMMKHQPEIDLT